ncbi:AraC family transcriptional regulator [Thomasclavelia ramosa]|uniref:AraC family transcriptional regulator n=1 Tax=Thomasclavelia ramosa TaxID=1547 RepID=UPI0022E06F28|nr:AraC family transcriptional regulator [Thomasclavelia ramosa]
MEWIERLNTTIEYIENHLTEKIYYEQLAKIAGCPSYHFQKTFLYMTNISLSEYIRKRRISLAAVDLQTGEDKIIDIALKYGYESPTAFNRAFQAVHGIAPSLVRKKNVQIKSFPALKFTFSIQGLDELSFRIEKKDSFKILGISSLLSKELLENFVQIPKQWDKALNDGTLNQLYRLNNQTPLGLLGVNIHQHEDWRYFIAVSSTNHNQNFEEYHIGSATWAIFSGHGTNRTLQELQRRVITEWLPTSGYEYANTPDIEVYLKADPNDAIYEYWLPIIKK